MEEGREVRGREDESRVQGLPSRRWSLRRSRDGTYNCMLGLEKSSRRYPRSQEVTDLEPS